MMDGIRKGHALRRVLVQESLNEVLRCGRIVSEGTCLECRTKETRTLEANICIDQRIPVNLAFCDPSPNIPLAFIFDEWA